MAQLRQSHNEITKRNAEVIVIGPEKAEAFEAYFTKHSLPFLGLPDPRGSVLKLYGQEINLFKLGRMPAQLIIDMSGTVRFVHYGKSLADIPDNDEIISILDHLNSQ
jgi:peroxiredoxin